MKVIIAMSGGVDSSVAAYLLKKEGHDVIGLSYELWDRRDLASSNVCCSVETIELARSVAEALGVKHYTVDVRDAFYTHVIEAFCESYMQGRTPNPCILCNKYIKFDFLLRKARELGADLVATGHYARIEKKPGQGPRGEGQGEKIRSTEERFLLKKGIDPKKDQSYVLYVMKQEELAKTLFPLGGMNKDETRKIAMELGLVNALRAESQEICFVGDDRYANFIRDFSPESVQPGRIIDITGKTVGTHRGIAFYTIGQRKGLGIASLTPCYVAGINRESNTIVVGSRDNAMKKSIYVKSLNWVSVESLEVPRKVHTKIRSTMKEAPSTVSLRDNERLQVEFDEAQWAPAPGQSAVFYDGDVVLGGGIIE